MNITLRKYQNKDFSFLKEMLYEAVFWRKGPDTPSFEEVLEMPDVQKAIRAMGSRLMDRLIEYAEEY